jgi:hypothetical protein
MRFEPFVSFAGYAFSLTPAELIAHRGQPMRQVRNEVGLNEYDYGDVVLRFQDSGRLEEITAQAPVLHLGAVAVPFGTLAAFVCSHDAQTFQRMRFRVSPMLGLAFDPAQPCWVTALAKHCLPEWEAL